MGPPALFAHGQRARPKLTSVLRAAKVAARRLCVTVDAYKALTALAAWQKAWYDVASASSLALRFFDPWPAAGFMMMVMWWWRARWMWFARNECGFGSVRRRSLFSRDRRPSAARPPTQSRARRLSPKPPQRPLDKPHHTSTMEPGVEWRAVEWRDGAS